VDTLKEALVAILENELAYSRVHDAGLNSLVQRNENFPVLSGAGHLTGGCTPITCTMCRQLTAYVVELKIVRN
jgi:hypothetical protein